MRVPLLHSDIESQSGFKRIAKELSRGWPGPTPLKLSLARETLAKAFGYTDYHDVTKAASTWRHSEPAPSVPQVQNAIEQAIIEIGQRNVAMLISASSLKALVQSLPLHALSAMGPCALKRLHATTSGTPSTPSSHELAALANQDQRVGNRAGASANKEPLVPSRKPLPILALSEIQHLVKVVGQHGTLRDRALLVFMLSGLRTPELTTIKAHQVSILEQLPEQPRLAVAKVKAQKALGMRDRDHVLNPGLVVAPNVEVIEEYLRAGGFSKDDFLFPSSKDSKQPMSAGELTRICKRWSVLSKLEAGKISTSSFRRSLGTAITAKFSPDRLSEMTGHLNPSLTLAYTS